MLAVTCFMWVFWACRITRNTIHNSFFMLYLLLREIKGLSDITFSQMFPLESHNSFGRAKSVQPLPSPAFSTHRQVGIERSAPSLHLIVQDTSNWQMTHLHICSLTSSLGWLEQNSKHKAPLGFRSGSLFLLTTLFQVSHRSKVSSQHHLLRLLL